MYEGSEASCTSIIILHGVPRHLATRTIPKRDHSHEAMRVESAQFGVKLKASRPAIKPQKDLLQFVHGLVLCIHIRKSLEQC